MNFCKQTHCTECNNKFQLLRNQNKDADKNEIESRYQWNIEQGKQPFILDRYNLSTLSIDLSNKYSEKFWVDILTIIPNNQIYGVLYENIDEKTWYHLSILDENLNSKLIEILLISLKLFVSFPAIMMILFLNLGTIAIKIRHLLRSI